MSRSFEFTVDAKKYSFSQPLVEGRQILRKHGRLDTTNQLFAESEGDRPDIPISSCTVVDLREHWAFYLVPPCTGG